MKDYYDIYHLATKLDFDGTLLAEALRKTFANRDHVFTMQQFLDVMHFDDDPAMQKKWKAFVRKINTKSDDYSTVLSMIHNFLEKSFAAVVEGCTTDEKWSAENRYWTLVELDTDS